MSAAAAVGWVLALTLLAIYLWIRYQRTRSSRPAGSVPPPRPLWSTSPKPSEALLYIEADGSARELTDAEKKYVDTDFSPVDGARPYVKSRYKQRDGWGEIKGFLHRKRLPKDIAIQPAPPSSPAINTPEAVAASISALVQKHRAQ